MMQPLRPTCLLPRPVLAGVLVLGLLAPATSAQPPEAPPEAPAQTPADKPAEPAADAPAPPADLTIAPAEPTPTMGVDEVRIGMKGYGLTVFHGTKIEPFPVEVVSVVSNHGPQHDAIWIRCPDPRMDKAGPVQGMSGSPIFLWDEGEPQELGQGGRLVGAFAFGFSLVKECLVGVTPIEYMRRVGERATVQDDAPQPKEARAGSAHMAQRTFETLNQLAASQNLNANQRLRLRGAAMLLEGSLGRSVGQPAGEATPRTPLPPGPQRDGQVMPMLLPLSVGSPAVAEAVAPLLAPMGMSAVAAGQGLVAGSPPPSVDAEAARLRPGSVLSVPLAFGDLDLSAAGTVTDVMPDGTVVGFGHAMFGQGQLALPMATGFVHFVMPRISTSFKLAGSLEIAGTLLQDEVTAVAGTPARRFETAPVTVRVQMPHQEEATYHYQVVDHRLLTPTIASIVTMQSLTAVQDLPIEHTIYLDGEIRLSGDRTIKLDSMVPGGGAQGMLMELMPAITLAMQNPIEALKLEAMDITVRVEPELRVGTILNARLDKSEVAPGETVGMTVWTQPYGGRVQAVRTELKVPASLAEGDYPLTVSDAQSYLRQLAMSRPHLFATRTVDDLLDMLQMVMEVQQNALYVTLQLPEQGIAVGRQELPQLPSSRRAMIVTPTSTVAMPFGEMVEQVVPTDAALQGSFAFTLHVRKEPGVVAAEPAAAADVP